MEQVEITWMRSLKIWWSWAWRAWVLSLLVLVPFDIFFGVFVISRIRESGSDPARIIASLMLLWPLVIAAVIALQAQAMRWMLGRARWSDFRVAVLPRES